MKCKSCPMNYTAVNSNNIFQTKEKINSALAFIFESYIHLLILLLTRHLQKHLIKLSNPIVFSAWTILLEKIPRFDLFTYK